MATPDDLRCFGLALAEMLAVRRLTQEDLALELGRVQSSVSAWIGGIREPSPALVFRMEEVLDLMPGQLSRLLGYLPVEALRRQ